MPEDIEACKRSVLDDNPDMDESTAYAICNSMKNKGQLADFMELWDAEDADESAMLAEFRNPEEIRRVENGSTVTYKRVMLLSPGVWTDAGSEQTVDYSADGIRDSAENFVDIETVQSEIPEWGHLSNAERAEALASADESVLADAVPLNLLHGPAMYGTDSLDDVGEIPTDSIIVDDRGRLYGDLAIDTSTAQGETAADLMDEVLEAAQDPSRETPPVGPSVEIPADRTEATDRGMLELQEAFFSGVGIVFNPASRPVELGTQARERAVAMTAASDDTSGVIYRSLQGDAAVHTPEFNGTITGAPEEFPGMDDFETDDLGTISNHAVASTSGFPPAEFDDLLGFVVTTDGDLSLPLLREVAASLARADLGDVETFMGRLPPERQAEALEVVETLAEQNFDVTLDPDVGENEGDDESGEADDGGEGEAEGESETDGDELALARVREMRERVRRLRATVK